MLDKMKKLYDLQKKARSLQKDLKDIEIEARSTDGAVKVVYSGEQKLVKIEIGEEMLAPENKQKLEKTIEQVIGEAQSKASSIAAEKSKSMMSEMGLNIPGL